MTPGTAHRIVLPQPPMPACGLVAFADGRQTAEGFVLFGEALKGFGSRVYRARRAP